MLDYHKLPRLSLHLKYNAPKNEKASYVFNVKGQSFYRLGIKYITVIIYIYSSNYLYSMSSDKQSISMSLKNNLLIFLGWMFILLAIIGVVLPILPTTPFLILALTIFAKCSPRFHKMLLDNKHFGSTLQKWEQEKTVSRKVKTRATGLIILSFGVSIAILHGREGLQIMLVCLATVLLFFIWRINEK